MRPRLVALLAFLGCFSVGPLAFGQENTAEIRGKVVDSQDAGIPGVTILITNQATGVRRQGVSNACAT